MDTRGTPKDWLTFTPEQLEQARQIAKDKSYYSASMIMRELKVFYSRAVSMRTELVGQGFLTREFQVRRRKCRAAA